MFPYNVEPKQKSASSSGDADDTEFLPFVLNFQLEIFKYMKELKEQNSENPCIQYLQQVFTCCLGYLISQPLLISTYIFLYDGYKVTDVMSLHPQHFKMQLLKSGHAPYTAVMSSPHLTNVSSYALL